MPGFSASHARKVMACVEKYGRAPRQAPEMEFAPLIVQSWKRCVRDYALNPGNGTIEVVLDNAALCRRRERMGELYHTARAEMENLYQQTAGSGYAVLLTAPDGHIIERVGDPTLDAEFARFGLWPGANWSERYAGTNGMGTCAAERQPITIHRGEHFLSCNTSLSCSAAPICDPDGNLLAVLDASSARSRESRQSQLHTIALVSMSARLIENCHFLRVHRDQWVLRFHVRPEFVGLLTEGMLAIDEAGMVLAANPSAVRQLGLETHADLVGIPVDELLDVPANLIGRRGERQDPSVWPMRSLAHGKRYFATMRYPLRPGRRAAAARVPDRERIIRPLKAAHPGSAYSLGMLMAGGDPRMAYNVRCAERLMDRNVPLLLYGETGTGKDAFARAIHDASQRAEHPFVAVNCASIPESLIESELFGYRSGAFTGARRDGMRGKIQQSSGGTLFLDEIGDMPPELQTRLLRVLEQQEILPLGSDEPIPVELHVISATHRDLPAMVGQGLFREDLYYRLNGATLTLPPLRDRRDRELLIRRVLAEEGGDTDGAGIHEDAFRQLVSYHWPGNIRQLRNRIRTMLALCDDGIVRLADIPPELLAGPPSEPVSADAADGAMADFEPNPSTDTAPAANALASAERETLLQELERHRWNVTNTASALGVSRNTMYRKMKKHGIVPSH